MYRFAFTALFAGFAASAAIAGPYEAPPAPAPVYVEEERCTQSFDCFYVGLEYGHGTGSVDGFTPGAANFDLDADGTLWGGFAGYNFQNGALVYGGEVRILHLIESDNPNFQIADVVDLRARLGYAIMDNLMVYGAAGYSFGSGSILGTDIDTDGLNVGLGAEFNVTEQIFVGADFTARMLEGTYLGTDFEADGNSATIRLGFRF